MLNRTAIVLTIVGLSLTTFQKNALSDPEDFQYGTTVLMEGAGVALSTAMAKGAFAAGHPLQGAAFTAAAIGTAGAMGMTIYNWLQADQNGDPNSDGGSGDPGDGGVPPLPGSGTNPIDLGFDDLPVDDLADDPSSPNGSNPSNTGDTRNGNADVALDLLNPDPDSGFGADSLGGGSDLASGGSGGSIGGLNSSSFGKDNGAKLMADAIEKELSDWNPADIAKLRAGDEALMGSLMDSLGIEGSPNGIDFSMFSNMLNGMLGGGKEQPQQNGVLASELVNGKLSIFETIKKTTVVAATEFHPKAFVTARSGATKQSPGDPSASPRDDVAVIASGAKQSRVIASGTGHSRASGNLDPGLRRDDSVSMMPRRIGAGNEK